MGNCPKISYPLHFLQQTNFFCTCVCTYVQPDSEQVEHVEMNKKRTFYLLTVILMTEARIRMGYVPLM